MKKISTFLIFLMLSSISFSQCVNADFSLGNFTGWVGSTGDGKDTLLNGSSAEIYSNIVAGIVQGTTNSLPSDTGQQTIINDTTLTDTNTAGGLKMTPKNGMSCRLGNDLAYNCVSSQKSAARLEYTMAVTALNKFFTYQYALVLQDPSNAGHSPIECPKFTFNVLNSTGTVIDSNTIIASSNLPGFNTANAPSTVCDNSTNVIWKDWSSVSVDLSQYIGQNITLQFTTFDCTMGAHFGYAYISCYCGSTSSISEFDKNNIINISPNPSNGLFTLTLQNIPNKNSEIEIFNSLGERINKDILNTQTKTIDISGYSKGIYFLKISSEEKYLFKKIIKE